MKYEIDFLTDSLLRENAFAGFHDAGPNVDKELNDWKQEYEGMHKA